MMRGLILTILTTMLVGSGLGAQERGNPFFADNFAVKGTFIESWNPEGKVSNDDGVVTIAGGGLAPRFTIPDEFYLTIKLTLLKPVDEKKLSFAGITCGKSIRF